MRMFGERSRDRCLFRRSRCMYSAGRSSREHRTSSSEMAAERIQALHDSVRRGCVARRRGLGVAATGCCIRVGTFGNRNIFCFGWVDVFRVGTRPRSSSTRVAAVLGDTPRLCSGISRSGRNVRCWSTGCAAVGSPYRSPESARRLQCLPGTDVGQGRPFSSHLAGDEHAHPHRTDTRDTGMGVSFRHARIFLARS